MTGQAAHSLAVFSHDAARDLDAALGEVFHEVFVGSGLLRRLGFDDLSNGTAEGGFVDAADQGGPCQGAGDIAQKIAQTQKGISIFILRFVA